jgi:AcrR family transcriptional regulator
MSANPTEPHRAMRHDGEASRERLLRAGLALFAQHGYAKASTREIAEAAQTNIAAISYYFGDKAGLYRAVFVESQGAPQREVARFADAGLTLNQALRGLYANFLDPLKQGDMARQCMKLHAREMVDPTGLWEQEIATSIRPMHDALVAVLCRHFGVTQADDDLQRLAVCISGLGVFMHVGRDVTDAVAPALHAGADSLDLWMERLVMYAEAMVAAEARRRAPASPQSPHSPQQKPQLGKRKK